MSRIYTDGSCRLGVGGWAWWNEDTNQEASGSAVNTTNQRMEIYAAYEALHDHMSDDEITIVSDSAYLVNCFGQDWWVRWQRNNWLNAKDMPVANRDIWEPLLELVQQHGRVKFEWVKGHSGVHGNEKVDALASAEVADRQDGLRKLAEKPETGSSKTEAALKRNQEKHMPSCTGGRKLSNREIIRRRNAINEEVKNGTTKPSK